MLSTLLIITFVLNYNLNVCGQYIPNLIEDNHVTRRSFMGPRLASPPYSTNLTSSYGNSIEPKNREFQLRSGSQKMNTVTIPPETIGKPHQDHDKLVRKLSSIMLLESLLRQPNLDNKSPFPLLTIPKLGKNFESQAQKPDQFKGTSSINIDNGQPFGNFDDNKNLDVSTTNLTTITDSGNASKGASAINHDQPFQAASLKYFVDKLLSMDQRGIRRDQLSRHVPSQIIMKEYDSHNSNKTRKTLDMLIRDEYDSKVANMLKSLNDERKLTSAIRTRPLSESPDSINHRSETSTIRYEPITSASAINTEQSQQRTTPNLFINIPTTMRPNIQPAKKNYRKSSSESDEADSSDSADESSSDLTEEYDDEDSSDILESGKSSSPTTENPRRTSRPRARIPPYQFGSDIQPFELMKSNSTSLDAQSSKSSVGRYDGYTPSSIDREDVGRDDNILVTSRNPLVFSDGMNEVERSNKTQDNQSLTDIHFSDGYGDRNPPVDERDIDPPNQEDSQNLKMLKSDRNNVSPIFRHLLTSREPLLSLDRKLKGQQTNSNNVGVNVQNPLKYNGYVGKDDFLLWPSTRDWSRSLVNRSNNSNTSPQTTPSPSIAQLPPISYNLHQPSTNAQSIPSIIYPIDESSHINGQPDRRDSDLIPARKQNNESIQTHMYHPNRALVSSTKYSHQLHADNAEKAPKMKPMTRESSSELNLSNKQKEYEQTRNHNLGVMRAQTPPDQTWSPSKFSYKNPSNPPRPASPTNFSVNDVTVAKKYTESQRNTKAPIIDKKSVVIPSSKSQDEFTPLLNSDIENTLTLLSAIPTDPPNFHISALDEHKKNIDRERGNFSHDYDRFHFNSNKSLVTRPEKDPIGLKSSSFGSLGDLGNEFGSSGYEYDYKKGGKPATDRSKTPKAKLTSNNFGDYPHESDNGYNEYNPKTKFPTRKLSRDRPSSNYDSGGSGVADDVSLNYTKKESSLNYHEPAGSEMTLLGLDKSFLLDGQRNQTLHLIHHINPGKHLESFVPTIQDNANSSSSTTTTMPTSFSSTILPSTHFTSEASSEMPILDNSISIISTQVGRPGSGHSLFSEDSYQRTSSSNVQSTIQRPISTVAPKWQNSTTPSSTQQDDSNSIPTIAKTKAPSDKLAFILIGGSCALSVVCLVLAAMSMRCQDMCDDYRTLRNAEKAAIKLQRHRLKYTKSHQISRFNEARNSSSERMMDDMNGAKVIHNQNDDYIRKQTRINSDKLDHLGESACNLGTFWNSANTCQVPVPTLATREACGCQNWPNRHLPGKIGENRRTPWLQPHCHVQQSSRLRPLFGVGSSVGTFFPHRVNDPVIHDDCSSDGQILLDSQANQSYLVSDQRGLTIPRRHQRLTKIDMTDVCDQSNHHEQCNHQKPHSHSSRHICHHHRYNVGTSASDESEVTIDECDISCDGDGKCSGHHCRHHNHPSKLKLIKFKSNNHNHHRTTAWRLEASRKLANSLHNDQHQQVSSSESSSPAQCTCPHDQQPLLDVNNDRHRGSHKASHKHQSKHERASFKRQAKREKAMLVWSTNRDRLI